MLCGYFYAYVQRDICIYILFPQAKVYATPVNLCSLGKKVIKHAMGKRDSRMEHARQAFMNSFQYLLNSKSYSINTFSISHPVAKCYTIEIVLHGLLHHHLEVQ